MSLYDDYQDCPTGIHVHFYAQTPCQDQPSYLGKVPYLMLLAFDSEKRLHHIHRQKDVDMTKDFTITVPTTGKSGKFSFIAWVGINDGFIEEKLTIGLSTPKDVMARIKEEKDMLYNLAGKKIYAGFSARAVEMPLPEDSGTIFKEIGINLQEKTYRIHVITEFENIDEDSQPPLEPKDLNIDLKSPYIAFSPDGTYLQQDGSKKSPSYPGTLEQIDKNTFVQTFTTLGIPSDNLLSILLNKDGKKLFVADVLDDILLQRPEINLACTHDLEIKIRFKQKPDLSYYATTVMLNSWLIHSYKFDIGVD